MGASRVFKVGTVYHGSELAELSFAQTTDTVYLAHLNYPPSKLVRAGSVNWSFSTVTFGTSLAAPASLTGSASTPNTDEPNSGASYFPQNATYVVTAVSDDTGYESLPSATKTLFNDLTLKKNANYLSWPAVAGATRYNVYKADNTQFYGYIGTTQSTSFVDDNIGPNYSISPPTHYNPFAASGDYPSTVTLFQQRSIWARTFNAPNGVWASRSGQLENMDRSRPLIASDSISFAIMSGQANAVNALSSTNTLLALTSDAVFLVDGDGNGGILTGNAAPAARRQVGRGSSRVPPIVVDSVVFYSPSVGATVRTLGFDYVVNGLKGDDVSIFSPHLFEGHSIVSWAYAQEPRSLIWAVRDDGVLLCFTWEQAQNVWGWTRCDTDGKVMSVCAISENGEDRIYMTVERTIGGVTHRFVEQMASHRWDTAADTCYVDCALTATFDPPVSEVTGLWHLEGRTDIAGVVDGVPVDGLTVTNGAVTLPGPVSPGSVVTLGIPYTVEIETLPIRTNVPGAGSNVGRVSGAGRAVITLQNSANLKAGIDLDARHLFTVRPIDEQGWTEPGGLMNGDHLVTMDNKVKNTASVAIQQHNAAPLTVLGVAIDLITNG